MQELAERIEATLQAYINDPEPLLVKIDPPIDLRELAAELKALPIVLDMGGCYCLRSDGEIFSFIWDEPRELRLEGEERIRNLVLFQAAKKFPELGQLMPERPATAQDCDFCRGTASLMSFRLSSLTMFFVSVAALAGYPLSTGTKGAD